MKLIFATTNMEKIKEAEQILTPYGHQVIGMQFDFVEPYEGDMEEIAIAKLKQIEETEAPIFVDDSGIYFEAFPNFPGILTRRIFTLIGYKGIEKLLMNESRKAYFYGVIAFKWKDKLKVFHGRTEGTIIENIPKNLPSSLRFPFDPIFVPKDGDTVLADLPIEKRIDYSYRKIALTKLGEYLRNNSNE